LCHIISCLLGPYVALESLDRERNLAGSTLDAEPRPLVVRSLGFAPFFLSSPRTAKEIAVEIAVRVLTQVFPQVRSRVAVTVAFAVAI